MAEPQTKLPSLLKNSSTNGNGSRKSDRRVAFDIPQHNRISSSNLSDISSYDDQEKHRCFSCLAWACLFLFVVIIIFLFLGISYLAFLKGGMPIVDVKSFNITKLQVDGGQKLDAVVHLGMRFSNKNEKLKLLYGPLVIDVSSEDVELGKSKVGSFTQNPKNDTDLEVTMTLNNAIVDKYALGDLKSDIEAYEMVLEVYVSGKIGMQVGSLHMINVPFLASCHDIKKMDVDFGRKPQCDVGMFTLRPSAN